ncbi:MAG: iron ABC transporter permease, partial [Cetobacterium sp.]
MEIIDREKKNIIFIILILITVFVLCISIGTVYIPFLEIWKVILKKLFNLNLAFQGLNYEEIIYYVRLPRVLVGCLVGGGLALSGAVMQSVFKNPMADAGILGISSGASLGAVITIALGLTAKSMIYMPVMAIICSFVLGMIVYKLSSYRGRTSTLTLILSGVAMSTLVGAIISLIITNISEHQMKEYVFWSMGSLVGRRWEHVHLIAIPIILISFYIMRYSRELNILLLGDEESHSLGINPNKFRKKILF